MASSSKRFLRTSVKMNSQACQAEGVEFLHRRTTPHLRHYSVFHLLILCCITITAGVIGVACDRLLCLANLKYNLIILIAISVSVTVHILRRPATVYLVDHACYRPPEHLKVPLHRFMKLSELTGEFDKSSLQFQRKILDHSGVGEESYAPEALLSIPPSQSMPSARGETEQVVFGAMDDLFQNTQIKPMDIAVLVVNCSLFNPMPSLSAMIVNKYKLRSNIMSFNLGGMGCSAGLIALGVARDMLRVHRDSYAVVVSTENIARNWYYGNNKSMLITNCLFRVGGTAVLLSNKLADKKRAKYQLLHLVRTHQGADDSAFQCIHQQQDDSGKTGVSLSKDLVAVAGEAIKMNITALAPLVLPIREKLLFFLALLATRLSSGRTKQYIPDLKRAFDHFCIHSGGRAIIDGLERKLQLDPVQVEASRMTLHRFGNTSSSSVWYELAYIEAKGRVRKGHTIWQIAFGSGFKCNGAVWMALSNVHPSPNGPWEDSIHKYPVTHIP